MNYAHSRNTLSKDFFIFILTLAIHSYGINFMNARVQSAFPKYTQIHHVLTSVKTPSVPITITISGLSPACNHPPH